MLWNYNLNHIDRREFYYVSRLSEEYTVFTITSLQLLLLLLLSLFTYCLLYTIQSVPWAIAFLIHAIFLKPKQWVVFLCNKHLLLCRKQRFYLSFFTLRLKSAISSTVQIFDVLFHPALNTEWEMKYNHHYMTMHTPNMMHPCSRSTAALKYVTGAGLVLIYAAKQTVSRHWRCVDAHAPCCLCHQLTTGTPGLRSDPLQPQYPIRPLGSSSVPEYFCPQRFSS